MENKERIVYKYYFSKTDTFDGHRYYHPTFQFIILTESTWNGQKYSHHQDLFSVVFQTTHPDSILKSYAPHVKDLNIQEYTVETSLKLLKRLINKDIREFIKTIMKYDRVIYDSSNHSFFPRKFKNIPELYWESFKKGLKLSIA